ncbi:hypothetical protein EW146_g3691 [Bondarzewia mesenterica]|uniref:Uncharacterized protein n=1 Tax=Bondarzewia mesenterica TaxID=1095465 RepID=A0A4S4LWR7_9AGAM|nr:hypothetical protein EW146_g3691 [Bondarzewia mesenterica]
MSCTLVLSPDGLASIIAGQDVEKQQFVTPAREGSSQHPLHDAGGQLPTEPESLPSSAIVSMNTSPAPSAIPVMPSPPSPYSPYSPPSSTAGTAPILDPRTPPPTSGLLHAPKTPTPIPACSTRPPSKNTSALPSTATSSIPPCPNLISGDSLPLPL